MAFVKKNDGTDYLTKWMCPMTSRDVVGEQKLEIAIITESVANFVEDTVSKTPTTAEQQRDCMMTRMLLVNRNLR
jgi:hypothetical protein